MVATRYLLAVLAVFLLGSAAGSFLNHRASNPSYVVPLTFAVLGIVAAIAAWKLDKFWKKPRNNDP
jgi:uncharacterized membrane protein YoaK (UPF0700 family)